ncbi:MAG: hypothetical protein QM632_00465 [Micrococcaceae bacterium]
MSELYARNKPAPESLFFAIDTAAIVSIRIIALYYNNVDELLDESEILIKVS